MMALKNVRLGLAVGSDRQFTVEVTIDFTTVEGVRCVARDLIAILDDPWGLRRTAKDTMETQEEPDDANPNP